MSSTLFVHSSAQQSVTEEHCFNAVLSPHHASKRHNLYDTAYWYVL